MVRSNPTEVEPDALTSDERRFLHAAQKKYRAKENWFDFESFAFGMGSPLFKRDRSHLDVLQHPLYLQLKEMWLDLGREQGFVAVKREEPATYGTRGKASGGR